MRSAGSASQSVYAATLRHFLPTTSATPSHPPWLASPIPADACTVEDAEADRPVSRRDRASIPGTTIPACNANHGGRVLSRPGLGDASPGPTFRSESLDHVSACSCDPMSRKWAVEGKWCSLRSPLSQARSTHSIQFVGVSNPLENGVALKVVEEFEVVVTRNAKDLYASVSERSCRAVGSLVSLRETRR